MKSFWKWFDRINDVMAGLAGLILVFICAAVCYSIGMRFLFKQTTIWIMQTTEYALLWILFLSTTWLLREGGHITTDIVHSHLSEKTKRCLDFIMFTLAGIACVIMVCFGFDYIGECMTRSVNDVRAVHDSEMARLHNHPHRQPPACDPALQNGVEQGEGKQDG